MSHSNVFSVHQRAEETLKAKAKPANTAVVKSIITLPVSKPKGLDQNSVSLDHLANTTLAQEVISEPDNIGGIYIKGRKKRSVALETATFTAFNDTCSNMPVHERGIGALLDTGAQRTMITSDTVNKLGFEVIERKAATLQGFENQKPVNRIYDIVN